MTIRFAPKARASCGFLLAVETGARTLAVRVPEWYKAPQDLPIAQWPYAEPFVALIVQLGADRSQIVVARGHGVSVALVSLYGVVDERLSLLEFPPPFPDMLTLFGSAGTGTTAARCRWGGPLTLVHSGPANRAGTRWRFTRVQYGLTGRRFDRIKTLSVVVPERQRARVADRWGAWDNPFEGCLVARGRRL